MIVAPMFQTNTKTASGGRTPQADAHVCGANLNSYESAYVSAWESHYGKLVPTGYLIHHMRGDGPHGVDPLYLVAMPRGLHTAMHNRARATGTLELPQGWVAVRGVLMLQSDAPARSHYKARTLVGVDTSPRVQCDQRIVGVVENASRTTYRRAIARGIPLPDVPMLPLPDHAGKRARQVYAIVKRIFPNRWRYYPGAPIPLNRDYVVHPEWCDGTISAKTAERGVHDLVKLRILEVAGTEPSHCGGRPMLLYLPAPVTADAVSVTGDAPPVVAEAMPIPEVYRASLRAYANALDDTTDQHPYWKLKERQAQFEQYVLGLSACSGMRNRAAFIRARLAEDEPMINTMPAPVIVGEPPQEWTITALPPWEGAPVADPEAWKAAYLRWWIERAPRIEGRS